MTTLPRTTLRQTFRTLGLAAVFITLAGCDSMGKMPTSSKPIDFTAAMSAAAEVPPKSTGGTGTLTAELNKSTNVLSWKMSYTGLTGPATMAHFHGPAMPGVNAGVVVPFPSAASPNSGSTTITPAQAADLVAGKWYVNVHTEANPGGEIRGQVIAK